MTKSQSKETFIWYDGPTGSGRTTSIKVLLMNHNPVLNYLDNLNSMCWQLQNYDYNSRIRNISVAFAINRKFEPYDDQTFKEEFEDPWVLEKQYLEKLQGIIFVVTLDPLRRKIHHHYLARLHQNLRWVGRNPRDIPMVFQLNHMDLEQKTSIEEVKKDLKWYECIYQPSIAYKQLGVKYAVDSLIEMIDEKNDTK